MDKTAIQQIQESESLSVLSESLSTFSTNDPVIALPNGFKIETLEQYMPNRSSYRVNYETISMKDFTKYCDLESNDNTSCFIDTEKMVARTFFDLGSQEAPLHRRHIATLKPKMTAPYSTMLNFTNSIRNQKQVAEFIEDWSDMITVTDESGNGLTTAEASRSIRNITIGKVKQSRSKIGNFSQEADIMEKVEASNNTLPIPSLLTFRASPYLDFKERDFTLQLSLRLDEDIDHISINLRVVKLDLIEEIIGNEFLESIQKLLPHNVESFIGSI